MTNTESNSADCELKVCSHEEVSSNYDDHFGSITIQFVEVLLDSALVKEGSCVLDVCKVAGYTAGATYGRRARAIGLDFSAQLPILQFK